MFRTLGIIPARIGSTRLPKKPLLDFFGKSLIQRTYEAAMKSKLISRVAVATDSEEIEAEVLRFGGIAYLTSADHPSGTSRLLELAEKFSDYNFYLNIQGDHPLLEIEHLDSLVIKLFDAGNEKPCIVTPVVRFQDWSEIHNPNVVKAVLNQKNEAMYFSRHSIPFVRNEQDKVWLYEKAFWKHLGLYGFNALAVKELKRMASSVLEVSESLEQLSWLYQGMKICCVEVEKDVLSVDTPEDVERVKNEILKRESVLC